MPAFALLPTLQAANPTSPSRPILLVAFLAAAGAFALHAHSRTRSRVLPAGSPGGFAASVPLFASGLRLLREGLWDNPVVAKEVRETFAARRSAIIFAVFLAALSVAVYIAWPREAQLLQNIDQISRRLFSIVGTTMLVLVAVFAPSFSAVAVTGEKERRCFELLVTSGISGRRVLLGKLIGSLLFLGVLIICSAPIVSVCLFLGGIAPREILGLYLTLLEVSLAFALIGLVCSCQFERNNAALGVTYAVAIPAAGLLLLWGRDGRLFSPAFSLSLAPVLLLGALAAFELLASQIRRPREIRPQEEESEEYLSRAVGLVLNRALVPDRWLAPPRRADLIPDGLNPVLDKEIRSELIGQGTLMLRVIIQIGLALTLFPFTVCYLLGQQGWYFAYLAAFTMLIAPSFACGMFTGEHENRTFALLVTTLLEPRQIVLAKFLSAARLVLLLLAILIAPSLVAVLYAHSAYIRDMALASAALAFAVCAGWALLLVAISLAWSMASRRTTAALVASYLTAAGLFLGPLLIHQIIISFPLLPDAWAPFLLPLSPLTHLFALAPGKISATLLPPDVLSASGAPQAAVYAAALTLATALLVALMIRAYEWTWRRWRAMGEA